MSDPVPQPQSEPAPKKWWKRKLWVMPVWAWLLVGLLALGGIGNLLEEPPDEATPATTSVPPTAEIAAVTSASPATTPSTPQTQAPAATEPATPSGTSAPPVISEPATTQAEMTPAQANAVRAAQSYLDFMGFSRQGLIDQLSSEYGDKFAVEDATFAVDSLDVDWNEQAARSAESYLELQGFSCQGLIDQLSSEYGDKYTVEQATYGAQQAGIC